MPPTDLLESKEHGQADQGNLRGCLGVYVDVYVFVGVRGWVYVGVGVCT